MPVCERNPSPTVTVILTSYTYASDPEGQSGMRCTHARPEKRVKRGVLFKTMCDACGAFRGAKTPFFRN